MAAWVAPFHPDTTLYEDLGAVPPDLPVGLESRANGLERLVEQLSAKGFRVYAFGIPDHPIRWLTDEVNCLNNPRAAEDDDVWQVLREFTMGS